MQPGGAHTSLLLSSSREKIVILDLRPNFRWWKYAPPFLVDFLYTTGPIFRLKPSQKGTVSVRNCSGAAPIAPCSDDQHMQLWARARRELTWLRHGPANCGQICGQVPLRALPANRTIACMHHRERCMVHTGNRPICDCLYAP